MKKPLNKKQLEANLKSISGWTVNKKETELSKKFKQPDFISGLMFAARITVRAELEGHHPILELAYGSVKIKLSTHEIKGLTKKDFTLAKMIDDIYDRM